MREELETARLRLRALTPEDYMSAFAWCGDPAVNKFMIYPLYHRAEDIRTWLEGLDPENPDSFDFGIERKDTGLLIGSAGMYCRPGTDI